MRISKPDWVSHIDDSKKGKKLPPIYSIDIHPDGTKFATGGMDTKVRIWSTENIFPTPGATTDSPNLLCCMTNHSSSVLCVRWNEAGTFLASSSDDKVIVIWVLKGGPSKIFGGDPSEQNHETWSVHQRLAGHTSDVVDLAWSPGGRYLASCSLDNTVKIWDAITFAQIKTLKHEMGGVKGVVWDPAGKFLASQSEAQLLKVWSIADWSLEASLSAPFRHAGQSFFLRPSWSPEGSVIVAPNSVVDDDRPASVLIKRNDWGENDKRDSLIGHNGIVQKFNPVLFSKEDGKSKKLPVALIALGSEDSLITVWATGPDSGCVTALHLFSHSVFDLSWSTNGKMLAACSFDGTVAFINFDDDFGTPMSRTELKRQLGKYEGTQNAAQLPESSMQLEIEASTNSNSGFSFKNFNSNSNLSASGGVAASISTPPQVQQETTTANGRRKITPVFVASSLQGISPIPKRLESFREPQSTTESNGFRGFGEDSDSLGEKRKSPSDSSSSAPKKPRTQNEADPDVEMTPKPSAPETPVHSHTPTPSGATSSSQVTSKATPKPVAPSNPSPQAQPKPAAKKPVTSSADGPINPPRFDPSPRIELGALSEFTSNRGTMHLEVENNYKGIAGRGSRLICTQGTTRMWTAILPKQVLLLAGNELFSAAACQQGELHIFSSSGRRLFPCIQLDAISASLVANGPFLLNISCAGAISIWNVKLQTSVLNEKLSFLGIAESNFAEAYITPKGIPVITLENNFSYTYDFGMKVWFRIADSDFDLSDFRKTTPSPSDGLLGSFQGKVQLHPTEMMNAIQRSAPEVRQAVSISHLESQLASASALKSSKEYISWLRNYVKRLSDDSAEDKLRDLFRDFLGPSHMPTLLAAPAQQEWNPMQLEFPKRELLRQAYMLAAQNRKLQPLVEEFKASLEEIAKNQQQ